MSGALLFGKLPAHGDFVARGMDVDERDALDLYLAASLADARAAFEDAFHDLYEEAPPWRFAWADPAGWTAGAMALSVDGVGRRYPILAARAGLAGEQVEHAADLVEGLLYDALEGGWGADRLCAAIDAAVPGPLTAWQGGEGWWTLGGERFIETALSGARPAGLMTAVLTPVAQDGGRDDA